MRAPSQPLVSIARELAARAHAAQKRKVGDVPYFVHLESVARILEEHGHRDEVQLAAAYLHDVFEDQPAFGDEVRVRFPAEVTDTVAALTEAKCDERGQTREKRARFADYLSRLRRGDEAAQRALPISCADKIDNVRSIVDAERRGIRLFMILRTRPGEHLPQLAALRELYAPVVSASLLAEFDRAVRELEQTLEAWLPGRAVAIAADAHLGQYDKAGAPYIEHPLRLWQRARTREEKMAAVLHDVVEDGPWTLDELRREGFPRAVVRAIDHLTRREGESYEGFIERVAGDRLATRVKLLDLEDNSDLGRLPSPTDVDRERVAKYALAAARLRGALELRSLEVRLDPASQARVRALAALPDRKGDHVTLAHRVHPDRLDPAWLPAGAAIGQRVAVRAIGVARDERAQALVVEIGGGCVRPFDGQVLHVTISTATDTRSAYSNDLLARSPPLELVDLPLEGDVVWVEE